MEDWRRRLGLAFVGLLVLLVVYTLIYQWALATFEGQEKSFLHSMRIVVEILTTAGFGGDTEFWTTDPMHLLVILMNVSALALVFVAIPLLVVPMLREAMTQPLPESSDLTDHVILCGHSYLDEVLTDELEASDVPYLYVEQREETVRELLSRGMSVMLGDAERVETFEAANAAAARAVVADINDEVNPTIILSAHRANADLEVLSVVRDVEYAPYHEYAGADGVIEGPRILGESLGMRAVTSFAEKFRATLEVENHLKVTELLVGEGSDIAGETIRETTFFDDLDATIIGGWFGGKFVISPAPDTVIEENTILLVAGHFEDLDATTARPLPTHVDDPDRVVVCGHGVVGRAVCQTLDREAIAYNVIDLEPQPEADVVGDATAPRTLRAANVTDARAVVLALDQDTTAILATLVINEIAPDVEIIARCHDPDNVWKLYNAGADFVLSMATITGEMLAGQLLEHRQILTPTADFEFVRTSAPALVGSTLAEADIRARTGCTIIAVEREGRLLTELGPDFEIEDDDVLIASGSHASTEQLVELTH